MLEIWGDGASSPHLFATTFGHDPIGLGRHPIIFDVDIGGHIEGSTDAEEIIKAKLKSDRR